MNQPAHQSVDLAPTVSALAAAASASDVFRELLQGTRLLVPRAAVFLVRRGQLRGWGSVGYDREPAERQRAFVAALQGEWLARPAASGGTLPERRGSDEQGPDFGQARAALAAGVAVTVAGKPLAVVLAEAFDGEQPWDVAGLGMLATVAALRLELALAQRRLDEAAGRAATATPPAAGTPQPAAPPPSEAHVDPGQLDAARRFARLVATDIHLYNEEAVLLGRRHGDLAERLSEPLTRGRESFLERHASLGPTGLRVFHEALVQVLAAGDASLLPSSALDG